MYEIPCYVNSTLSHVFYLSSYQVVSLVLSSQMCVTLFSQSRKLYISINWNYKKTVLFLYFFRM
jgi:hypothetical protein